MVDGWWTGDGRVVATESNLLLQAWTEATTKVGATLEVGKASADKMTLHADQDALYTAMKARWVEVDKAAKEWTVKLAELSGMWSKQTGEGRAGMRKGDVRME